MPVLTKLIGPGDKVDVIWREKGSDGGKVQHRTRVFDVVSDDEIKLNMPIVGTKIVLLSIGVQYELCFYTATGLYQCYAEVKDRYKSNNVFVVSMELTTAVRRFQRREYYRLNTILDLKYAMLNEETYNLFMEDENNQAIGLDLIYGIIVDISGGGVRFISKTEYKPGDKLFLNFSLNIGGKTVEFKTIGIVLDCNKVENKPGDYQNRVKYVKITNDSREKIIRYIFEEERKLRRKEMS